LMFYENINVGDEMLEIFQIKSTICLQLCCRDDVILQFWPNV